MLTASGNRSNTCFPTNLVVHPESIKYCTVQNSWRSIASTRFPPLLPVHSGGLSGLLSRWRPRDQGTEKPIEVGSPLWIPVLKHSMVVPSGRGWWRLDLSPFAACRHSVVSPARHARWRLDFLGFCALKRSVVGPSGCGGGGWTPHGFPRVNAPLLAP